MERLSERGHHIRIIDFEISWRKKPRPSIQSRRKVYERVTKATPNGYVTVIRPFVVHAPLLDYLSMIVTHGVEVSRQLRDFKPDIVVCFGILNARMAISLSRRKGVPVLYYIIDELHRLVPERIFQGIARAVESSNMRGANLVVSINEELRDYTLRMGAKQERTRVLGAGVDLDKYSKVGAERIESIRTSYALAKQDRMLFFMGWLYHFTGLKEVVLELASRKKQEMRIGLLIIGAGELWNSLKDIVEKQEASNVVFLEEWMPYDKIADYVSASDVCILPSYNNDVMRDIVPIKMYEYMAAGKPVISTRLPGIVREFGINNGVVYVDKPEDVVGRAIEIIEANQLSDLGSRAKSFVSKSDWSKVTSEFERLLEGML
jgi:glycosyltransferase involved in cell wall biosynthesis